ncbi:MAG: CPBP family glutamic-type intramembrane protease [Nitrospirales bacterium]
MKQRIRNQMTQWCEVGAVLATGVLHVVFKSLGAQGIFIVLASVCWISYIVWQVRQDSSRWMKWGFQTKNLSSAFFWPTLIFIVATAAMAWYGVINGRVLWEGHMLLLLVLYPLWGILQQFLVQALGVANLFRLFPQYGWWVAVSAGVILFTLVHYLDWVLMAATGLLACVFIPLYIRDRNLWPLGLYHGWLGTFFYLWVLGQDPWVTVFGK